MPSTLHVVSLADINPQPWKNGGGTTCELLSWPGAGPWALRLSVATIDRDGPFSAFDGIDRWFAVIEGAGVELGFGQGWRCLRPGDEPLAFAGEQAPACRLLGASTRDLNLMVRRSAGHGQMLRALAGKAWAHPAPWRGVYVADEARLLREGRTPTVLPPHTLAFSVAANPAPWMLDLPSADPGCTTCPTGWWLAFEPLDAGRENSS